MQQTSATAYDGDGHVTGTIDALGRVTASAFNADGQDAADAQGQVAPSIANDTAASDTSYTINSGISQWQFNDTAPAAALSYNIYIYSATPLSGHGWQNGYTVVAGAANCLCRR